MSSIDNRTPFDLAEMRFYDKHHSLEESLQHFHLANKNRSARLRENFSIGQSTSHTYDCNCSGDMCASDEMCRCGPSCGAGMELGCVKKNRNKSINI